MNRLIDKLFHAIDCFTGILTGLMVLFVFLNVVLRTFFIDLIDENLLISPHRCL